MDPVTTGIGAALIAKALPEERRGPIGIWVMTGAALFPDIDVFSAALTGDPMSNLTIHRVLTHSFAGILLQAPLLALVARAFGIDKSYRRLLGLCALAIVWHIFTDAPTSWGTVIYFPFSWERVAWDWIFIIDLYYTGLLLLPQLIAWVYVRKTRPGAAATALRIAALWFPLTALVHWTLKAASVALDMRMPFSAYVAVSTVLAVALAGPWVGGWGFRLRRETYARAGVTAFAAYVLLAAVSHAVALRKVEASVAGAGLDAERVAALPQPLSPFRWAGMALTGEGVHINRFNVFDDRLPGFTLHRSDSNEHVERARELPEVKTYLWFARFPVARYQEAEGRHIVEFAPMRFNLAGPVDDESRVRFGFRVVFDEDGEVSSSGFLGRD